MRRRPALEWAACRPRTTGKSRRAVGLHPPGAQQKGLPCVLWGVCNPHRTRCDPHGPIPCDDPALLEALCAFADEPAQLPDPHDPRGVRYPLAVLLDTLLVALATDKGR